MKYKAAVLLIVLILHNVMTLSEWDKDDERDIDERISVPNVNISYNKNEEIFRRKNRATVDDNLKTKLSYNLIINYDPFQKKNNDKVHKMDTIHDNVDSLLKSEYYENVKPELNLKRFGKIDRNSYDNFISHEVSNNHVEDKTTFEPNMISYNIHQNSLSHSNKIIPKRNDFEYGPVREQLKSTSIGVSSAGNQDKPTTTLGTLKNDSRDSLEYSYSSLDHHDELSYHSNHSDDNSQTFYHEYSNNYTSEPHSDVNYYELGDSDDGEELALGLGSFAKKSQKHKKTNNKPKKSYDQTHSRLTQLYEQPFQNGYQQLPRHPVQNYVYPDYGNPTNQVHYKQYPQPPINLPPYRPFQPPLNNRFQPPPHNQFEPPYNNHKRFNNFPSAPAKKKSKSKTYAPYTKRPLNHKLNAIESTWPSAPKPITPNIDTEIDDCELGNTWTMNCYDCVCNGSTAICIRDLHCTPPPQNEPKLCKPYTSFPLDGSICHRCECNADGLPVCTFDYYACSRRTKQIYYHIKEGRIKYLRRANPKKVDYGYDSPVLPILTTSQNTCPRYVIDFNVLKCQPRSRWTARCYICECDSEGQPLCVKILNCVPAPFGIPPKCRPGTILSIEGCQKCWCDDDGFPAGDIPPPKVQGLGAKSKRGKKALSAPLPDALNEIFASFLNTSLNDTNTLSSYSGSLEDHDVFSPLDAAAVDDTDPIDSLPASIEFTNISSHSASIEGIYTSSAPTVSLNDADVSSSPPSLEQDAPRLKITF